MTVITPQNNVNTPQPPKEKDLKAEIRAMLARRATGGIVKGELAENEPLVFEYADMVVSAHIRSHYDGVMVRDGGSLLLVMRATITLVPQDDQVLKRVLEHTSRYPYTSVCLIPAEPNPEIAGSLVVYSTLVAPTLTNDELDLALRSMVQHYHHLPLEMGANDVDPLRRKLFQIQTSESSNSLQTQKAGDDVADLDESDVASDEVAEEPVIKKVPKIREELLSKALTELDSLIGLSSVKSEIEKLIAMVKFDNKRAADGTVVQKFAPHLVLVGNPGTCKTTVASHVAEIYHALGIVKRAKVKVVTKADLVAAYIGQTAIKTRHVCRQALDGVLFVDEAYSLTEERDGFGGEAIETLLTEMESHRGRLVVIIAGYPEQMRRFIASNPGLQSRFDRTINFPDYSSEELVDIYLKLAQERQYELSSDAVVALKRIVQNLSRGPGFGNGREARKWLDAAVGEHAKTWLNLGQPDDFEHNMLGEIPVIAGINHVVAITNQSKLPPGYL